MFSMHNINVQNLWIMNEQILHIFIIKLWNVKFVM
jgi:hypothetical protein